MSEAILFVAADPREFTGWLPRWESVEPLAWPLHWARQGRWKGRRMLAVANGAGPLRAAEAVDVAARSGGVAAVWNIGFCGALDPALSVGGIFVAERVNGCAINTPASDAIFERGALVSIDHVAQTAEEKRCLFRSGARAVEMEAAGAFTAALGHALPFFCVRSVSDLAAESFSCDFNAMLREDGRFDTVRLLNSALRRPFARFPELIRLQRRCRIASDNLGEFLATCRF